MEYLPYIQAVLTFVIGVLGKLLADYKTRLSKQEDKTQSLEVKVAELVAHTSGLTFTLQELKTEVSDVRNNMVRRDDFNAAISRLDDTLRSK